MKGVHKSRQTWGFTSLAMAQQNYSLREEPGGKKRMSSDAHDHIKAHCRHRTSSPASRHGTRRRVPITSLRGTGHGTYRDSNNASPKLGPSGIQKQYGQGRKSERRLGRKTAPSKIKSGKKKKKNKRRQTLRYSQMQTRLCCTERHTFPVTGTKPHGQ